MSSPAGTTTPILYFIFNRPDHTRRVFEAIRAARPQKLLVVADGARADRAGEADLCARTRAVIEGVDWPCEVLRNFSDANMGCGRRVASGYDWAFGQVEAAIILEDDCLPDPSFFPFCAELLARYRDDARVMMISGNNFQAGQSRTLDSYYFSAVPHLWGWATWRRAWRLYDFAMSDWPQRRATRWLEKIAPGKKLARRWARSFDDTRAGQVDTWDYQWMYCMFAHGGLSAVPDVNLITNIGFGAEATHTFKADDRHVAPSRAIAFPLRHPGKVARCLTADIFEMEHLERIRLTLLDRLRLRLRAPG